MNLARIYKSDEYIGALYAPSLNAALVAIERAAGKAARIKAPLGGARTKAQCNSLGTSWRISDHYEGRPARAVDIDNRGELTSLIAARRGISFTAAVTVYYRIFADHGWRNITTDGHPFPSEPWHLANHSSTPAGSGGVPLPSTRKKGDTEMVLLYGPDTGTVTKPGPKVFVVASKGCWDRYSSSYAAQLGSQYGSAVPLSLTSMLAKKALYTGAPDPAGPAPALTAGDRQAIAEAVADEQARRLET